MILCVYDDEAVTFFNIIKINIVAFFNNYKLLLVNSTVNSLNSNTKWETGKQSEYYTRNKKYNN